MDASQIISDLGGRDRVSAATGAAINTVVYWERRGGIPSRYWPALIDLSRERGAAVTVDHLIRHRGQQVQAQSEQAGA